MSSYLSFAAIRLHTNSFWCSRIDVTRNGEKNDDGGSGGAGSQNVNFEGESIYKPVVQHLSLERTRKKEVNKTCVHLNEITAKVSLTRPEATL